MRLARFCPTTRAWCVAACMVAASAPVVCRSTSGAGVARDLDARQLHPHPAEADQCIERLERANFNAVFLLVWYWGGQASFQSIALADARRRAAGLRPAAIHGPGVPPPTDRGPRLVRQRRLRPPDAAARAGQASRVGRDSGGEPGPLWYDLGKPQVRRFQSDLMIECPQRYDWTASTSTTSATTARGVLLQALPGRNLPRRYGCGPIRQLQRASFPIAGIGRRQSRWPGLRPPVVWPNSPTARRPSPVNELGKGKVLLFNWHALRPRCRRGRDAEPGPARWGAPARQGLRDGHRAQPRALRRQGGIERGRRSLSRARLQARADRPKTAWTKLPPGSLVVLADVYLIPDEPPNQLEQFVEQRRRHCCWSSTARSSPSATPRSSAYWE